MRLDRRFGEHQLVGDLGVGEAAGDGDEDLALARRDLLELLVDRGGSKLGSGSRCATVASSRRVVLGATTASPLATARIAESRSAGWASLSRKPLAPARSAV